MIGVLAWWWPRLVRVIDGARPRLRQLSTLLALLAVEGLSQASPAPAAEPEPAAILRSYRDYAMGHDGDAARGRLIFNDERRAACARCHSVDGSAGKAGPDLFAAGDKFPRRELIRAVLEPSAGIAVGYGTTIIETKAVYLG